MTVKNNFPTIKPSLNLDFANTKQLDPRITFTRASEGRYYDASTVALAEQNLLTYSQQFDNGYWGKTNGSLTVNAATAPDLTTTACELKAAAVSNTQPAIFYHVATVTGGHTYSIFVKSNTQSYVQLWNAAGGDTPWYATFDVATGVVGSSSNCTPQIQFIGNGWYRCIVTATKTGTIGSFAALSFVPSASGVRAEVMTTNGTESVYVWGAQLEQRSFATAYTPTTNQPITKYQPVLLTAPSGVPRFDHNPVTGESLGLLIEEQRTNLLTYSSDFTNAVWIKDSATITANTIVAPGGTISGSKLVATGRMFWFDNTGVTGAKVQSIYAKAEAASTITISAVGGQSVTGGNAVTVNLLTGAVTTGQAAPNVVVTSVGNGWYRIAILVNVFAASGNSTYWQTGATTGIYIWGAQLEAGAFATSYIPTVASQVTRAADAASMTGTNFSSWYRQDEGSYLLEFSIIGASLADRVHCTLAATDANDIFNSISSRNYNLSFVTAIYSGTTLQASAGSFNIAAYSKLKTSVGFKSDSCIGATQGVLSVLDNTVQLPTPSALRFPPSGCNHISRFVYYPKRLSNTELQTLTT